MNDSVNIAQRPHNILDVPKIAMHEFQPRMIQHGFQCVPTKQFEVQNTDTVALPQKLRQRHPRIADSEYGHAQQSPCRDGNFGRRGQTILDETTQKQMQYETDATCRCDAHEPRSDLRTEQWPIKSGKCQ